MMTVMIEVSPETEARAHAEAARQGRTVTELLGEIVETRFSPPSCHNLWEEKTLAETLAGRTGRVRSGGSSHGRNSETEFGRIVASKRQNGHS